MKNILFIPVLILILNACSNDENRFERMESQIDELEKKINDSYIPGFGEFMGNIQIHHAKLWFAGIHDNWELADFEVHEIKEALESLEKYQSGRVETKSLPMIYPALDRVMKAIEKKDIINFKNNYTTLTNTCNQCHQAVNYSFNNVKIPDRPPFSNQVFEINSNQ